MGNIADELAAARELEQTNAAGAAQAYNAILGSNPSA